jgi:hypothetical protein
VNPKVSKPNAIEIQEKDGSRVYYIYANSKQDIDIWAKAIQDAAAQKDSQPNSVKHHLHIDMSEYTSLVRSLNCSLVTYS